MGNYLHFGVASEAHVGSDYKASSEIKEVRKSHRLTRRLRLDFPPAAA